VDGIGRAHSQVMTKKKLQLHRETLRILTAPTLSQVVGGAEASANAGVQSIRVDTKVEPCQRA
jgi:hypothetical protein